MAMLLANTLYLYAGAVGLSIIIGVLIKVFYAQQTKGKFKEYQSEIAKSHSRILKLEVLNEKLQKRLNEVENASSRIKIA